MKIELEPGKYIVAVSGGVDSVVLLDLLTQQLPACQFVVAHFDHGIRKGSKKDRLFVQNLAKQYGLDFVYDEGRLGPAASEAKARAARYQFFRKVLAENKAKAIITAHHQDDVLETAIINILRGTGRKGLTALGSRTGVIRPLINVPKSQLIGYAREHNLKWREDPTNLQTDYLRNYIRHKILNRFAKADKQQLLAIINNTRFLNKELDGLLAMQLEAHLKDNQLDRNWFVKLPHEVAKEVVAVWLRANGLRQFDSKTIERLAIAGKVAESGSRVDIKSNWFLDISKSRLALRIIER